MHFFTFPDTMARMKAKSHGGTIGALLSRVDSFVNEITGKGVSGVDKTMGGSVQGKAQLTNEVLSVLHTEEDLAALVVDVIPDESFRVGFNVRTGDNDEDEDLSDKLKELGALEKLADADRWGRLYGAAALVVGMVGGGEPDQPVTGNVQRIASLKVVDRSELWPHTYDSWGDPETYLMTPLTIGGQIPQSVIHRDRLIMFDGVKTTKRRRVENSGYGDSVLQRVFDSIESFDSVFNNIETLLSDSNQAVFKMSGLSHALASEEKGTDAIRKRFALMNLFRSNHRALVLDAGDGVDEAESFDRQSTNFAGIADLGRLFMLRVSAATRIPVTILMGQSPAGMSATGESDFRGWFNTIEQHRTQVLDSRIRRLVDMIRNSSEWSKRGDEKTRVEWPALWAPTAKEEAETRKINTDSDVAYLTAGVLVPEEVTLSRFTADGYGAEINLPAESRAAREASLAEALADLAAPPEPAPVDPAPPEDPNADEISKESEQAKTTDPEQANTEGTEPETGE